MAQYAHPEILVSTQWVADRLNDPNVRIVESDEDVLLYTQGHIPGAVKIDWQTDLQDAVIRDYVGKKKFETLLGSKGIGNDTTVVFYGDKNNWWATYAFWVFKLFGHEKCLMMDGGRKRWELDGREFVREPEPQYPAASYTAKDSDKSIRAFRDEVLKHQKAGKPLVDVRSPGEFTGELLHMPDYPQEGALRGGHIPGALNIPWAKACNDDGTFKSAKDLEKLYLKENNLKRRGTTIAYCRIGERSSHTWFVLTYLLGFPAVKNYDGSWTEWGNTVGVPIERGAPEKVGDQVAQAVREAETGQREPPPEHVPHLQFSHSGAAQTESPFTPEPYVS